MKKIILIPFIFATVTLNAQIFDFYNKKLVGDTDLIPNKSFTFIITNINTFKYNVFVDNQSINYNKDIPDFFKKYVQTPNDTVKKTDLVRIKKNTDSRIVRIQSMKTKSIDSLKILYFRLKTAEEFYDALGVLIRSDLPPNKIIDCKKKYYQQFLGTGYGTDDTEIVTILDYYSKLLSGIPLYAISLMDSTKKTDTIIIDSILKYTSRMETSKLHLKLASLYSAINDQAFSVSTFISKPNSDNLLINIKAKPNPKFNDNSNEINLDIPFLIKGGFKIDFSTGFFVSNIVNQVYINKPDYIGDNINGYYLQKSEENSISYGIAGYIHAYWRNAKNINIGLSVGIGFDQNTQMRIMPGMSILLGRKERFIINGGLAIGKCKELSNTQSENHLYREKTNPEYSEPFKIGYFFGISYNLTK